MFVPKSAGPQNLMVWCDGQIVLLCNFTSFDRKCLPDSDLVWIWRYFEYNEEDLRVDEMTD